MQNLDNNSVWTLDPSHSEVSFTVRHAGISKVRGKFDSVSATAELDENSELKTASALIGVASVNTGSEDRDNHIRSADFFDVEQFSTMTFDNVVFENFLEEDAVLKGDLTIKDVTRPVELTVEETGVAVDPFGNTRFGVEAKTTISRKDFGLTWNAALEAGGVLVSDKVTIELNLSFIQDK